MLGTFLNGAAILAGGLAGLAGRGQLKPETQQMLRLVLAAFTAYAGLSAVWRAVSGSLLSCLAQLGIVVLGMSLGRVAGRLLRLQKTAGQLGAYANRHYEAAVKAAPGTAPEGFVTCSILFCIPPIAILGALEEGLTGSVRTLTVKSMMDGLAAISFAPLFGRGVLGAALPLVAFEGAITLFSQAALLWLVTPKMVAVAAATCGMLVFSISLLLLDIKRVDVTDYLPSLAIGPLLAAWLL